MVAAQEDRPRHNPPRAVADYFAGSNSGVFNGGVFSGVGKGAGIVAGIVAGRVGDVVVVWTGSAGAAGSDVAGTG